MKTKFILLFFICPCLLLAQVQVRLPDTTVMAGTIIKIPVYIDSSLNGLNVISYQFQISYTSERLTPTGIDTEGTMAQEWALPYYSSEPGLFTFIGAGVNPLIDKGVLLYIVCEVPENSNTPINFTGPENNFFNEGIPDVILIDGYISKQYPPTITVYPNNATLVVGESLQFSISGQGTPPYSWGVIDPEICNISEDGLLTANSIGFTRVFAIDDNNITDTTDLIETRGVELSMPDTVAYPGNEILIPVYSTDMTPYSYISGEISFSFNSDILSAIDLELEGTLLEGFSNVIFNNSEPGEINVVFAGTEPVTGSGVLFFTRFQVANLTGGSTSLSFENAEFNEGDLAKTVNGSFSITYVNINISPNSGSLIAGESMLFTVSGGTPPYSWETTDPQVAEIINSSGNSAELLAIESGVVKVKAFDFYGVEGITNNINVFDTYSQIPEMDIPVGLTANVPILIGDLPSGQEIFSFEGSIVFNSQKINAVEIITENTLTESWSVNYNLLTNIIIFAGANSTGIQDQGVLFYIKFLSTEALNIGENTPIDFESLIFNENFPLPQLINGSVTGVQASPNIIVDIDTIRHEMYPGQINTINYNISNTGLHTLLFTQSIISGNWITISPENGSIEPENSILINAIFNSENLQVGNYNSYIQINSNDPDNPIIIIPVYLEVLDPTLNAEFTAEPLEGQSPLFVQFSDQSTPQELITSWQWDFQNDGTIDSYDQNPEWIYNEAGIYSVSLIISDGTNEDTEIKENYITVVSYEQQQYSLDYGYQFISSRIIAQDPNMLVICDEILDNLDFIRNTAGLMLRKIGPVWINSIGDWVTTEAYLIRMIDVDEFTIVGDEIDPQTPINLSFGYQLVSFLLDEPLDALLAFSDILDNLNFVRNSEGLMLRKIGPVWVNSIGDLQPGEGYLVKMNADDVLIYPGSSSFTCGDPITDPRDEQTYNTVQIGGQCWMAENLNIGTRIDGVEEMTDNGIIEKYCYDNDPANCDIYGGLYQWNEMMEYTTTLGIQGICPNGWYIPTDDEWKILEGTVDSQYPVGDPIWNQMDYRGYDAGLNLKSTSGWYEGGNGSGLYGFGALPGGYRGTYGFFYLLPNYATFWSSSENSSSRAWYRGLYYTGDDVARETGNKGSGFSVRCLQDYSIFHTDGRSPFDNLSIQESGQPYELSGQKVMNLVAPNFIFEGGNAADPVYTIYVEGLEIGDEVAAYDGDILVGAMKINSAGSFENALPVFSTLNSSRGYKAGNPVILKVWDALTQSLIPFEYTMIDPYNEAYMQKIYPTEDGVYSLVKITKTENNIENVEKAISIYPNPSDGIFNISIEGVSGKVQIKVFDIHGNNYRFFEIEGKSNMISEKLDLKELAAGVYFVSFSGKDFSRVKKIVIQ